MRLRTHLLRCHGAASRDAFHGVLLRDTGALAALVPGIRHYAVNAVYDATHRLPIEPSQYSVDAITHMWFDDADALARAQASTGYLATLSPLMKFIHSSMALDVEQRDFVAPPPDALTRGRLLKRMSLLRRSESLDAASFQRTWEMEHGPRVAARKDALRGYFQDAVLSSRPEWGPTLEPCDGLTELWFDDAAGMESVLPQKVMSSVTSSAAVIISSISTFLVREIQLF